MTGGKRGCFTAWVIALAVIALAGLALALFGGRLSAAMGWKPDGLIAPFFLPNKL